MIKINHRNIIDKHIKVKISVIRRIDNIKINLLQNKANSIILHSQLDYCVMLVLFK